MAQNPHNPIYPSQPLKPPVNTNRPPFRPTAPPTPKPPLIVPPPVGTPPPTAQPKLPLIFGKDVDKYLNQQVVIRFHKGTIICEVVGNLTTAGAGIYIVHDLHSTIRFHVFDISTMIGNSIQLRF